MKYTQELHDETRKLVNLAAEENSIANGEGFYSFSTHRISALLNEIERLQSAATCEWIFFGCGTLFGSPTGFMKTACGHNWGELVDYKRLNFCPHCGGKIVTLEATDV